MKEQMTKPLSREKNADSPFRVRLPGFLVGAETGLGDAVKRITYAFGIKPCQGCERRTDSLNRWVAFTRRK